MKQEQKVAIRGHAKRGAEVIKYLEKLGGKNTDGFQGYVESLYYYIHESGVITNLGYVPHGYTLIDIFQERTFPRVMRVDDSPLSNDNKGRLRVVFMEKNGQYLAWSSAETVKDAESQVCVFNWKYAAEVDDPMFAEPKEEEVRMTVAEVSAALGKKVVIVEEGEK